MVKLSKIDTYIVINKTSLNDQDRKIITMLYQPIIGSLATNLYFTLWSYLDKNELLSCEWTHEQLINNMQNSIEEITEARKKLEAIGLIKTYLKESEINNYIYEIYSPVTPSDFFKNPLLSVALYSHVGKVEFEKKVLYFKIPKINLTKYKDITCKFTDMFISTNKTINKDFSNLKKIKRLGLTLTPKINLDSILELIPEEMLNKKSITKETKELIYKLSFVYNLSDTSIDNIIRNSINDKHVIDKDLLRENARNLYNFTNGLKIPNIIYKNQPEYLRKEVKELSSKAKLIHLFESTSPYDFLYIKNNNTKPTKTELNTLEYLLIDLKLNTGVVNVLVDYVLKINNNKLTKTFIESIASQWKRSNIETVEQAMEFAEKEYKSKQKYTKIKTKKQEEKPIWFDKKLEENTATEEEIKEFEKRLENLK